MATGGTSLELAFKEISLHNKDDKSSRQLTGMTEALKSLTTVLYTDNIRFIYELIQIADECMATNIILTIFSNTYLIIAHNGNPVDKSDLKGLCSIYNSTIKIKSNKVIIYSNGEYFRFDSSPEIPWKSEWRTVDKQTWRKENDRKFCFPWQNNPICIEEEEIPKHIRNFLNKRKTEIHVATIILLNNSKEIRLAINNLKKERDTFIWLRNISKMTFIGQSTDTVDVQDEISLLESYEKITTNQALQYGFHSEYLSQLAGNFPNFQGYDGLKSIKYLKYTEDNIEFSKIFWSYVINNIEPNKLGQSTKIYWGDSYRKAAIDGWYLKNNTDYIRWFVRNRKCIATTLNKCESSVNILLKTDELEELCGIYMPFPLLFSITKHKEEWHEIFNFKKSLSLDDYFEILEKIYHDEQNLEKNINRIQNILSGILDQMDTLYFAINLQMIQTRAVTLHLLADNNQWKLGSELYFYREVNKTNSYLNDHIPYLQLNRKNREHPKLDKFLTLFNIKQINMDNLVLEDKDSAPATEFYNKLIDIVPYLKNWLTFLSFSLDVISSIDAIIQEKLTFIESDCLQLFDNDELIQDVNIYFDKNYQKLYITRPWNSETVLLELPNKLCELLKIEEFYHKLRFLLKAPKEEINKHFKKLSINIPIDIGSVINAFEKLSYK